MWQTLAGGRRGPNRDTATLPRGPGVGRRGMDFTTGTRTTSSEGGGAPSRSGSESASGPLSVTLCVYLLLTLQCVLPTQKKKRERAHKGRSRTGGSRTTSASSAPRRPGKRRSGRPRRTRSEPARGWTGQRKPTGFGLEKH